MAAESRYVPIPPNISDLSDEAKRNLARELIEKTTNDNTEIARLTLLSNKSVAAIRKHAKGVFPHDPKPMPTGPPDGTIQPEEEDASDDEEDDPGEGEDESDDGFESPEIEMRNVDALNPPSPRGPTAVEREVVHESSAIADMNARIEGMERSLSTIVTVLRRQPQNGVSTTASPSGQYTGLTPGNGHSTMNATFESYREPIYIDNMRRATFEAWLARSNIRRHEEGLPLLKMGIDEFALGAMDEWFERRGISLMYSEKAPVRAPRYEDMDRRD